MVELDYDNSQREETATILSSLLARLSVEHLFYLLIILAATILRLAELDFVPLSPAEAIEALSVWNYWQPDDTQLVIGSPIYFGLTLLLTQLLGFSDSTMRLVPALFGVGLVILPWFLRHRIGRSGALVTALLLAISPLLTFASRSINGNSIALFAGFLLLIAWVRYQESGSKKWFFVLASSLALGLASTSVFYGMIFSLLVAWIGQAIIGPQLFVDSDGEHLRTRYPSRQTLRDSLAVMVITLVLGATALLLVPAGIGATAEIFTMWLGTIFQPTNAYTWISPFTVISRLEFTLLVIGIPALIWAARRDRAFPIFLAYWISGGLLLLLIQPGQVSNLLLIILPGYLLIGSFIDHILQRSSGWVDLVVFIIVLLAGGIAVANLARFGRLTSFQSATVGTYHLLLALTVIVLACIAITMIWSWTEKSVITGIVSGILFILLFLMWSDAWWLSRYGGNDSREALVATASDEGVRLLERYVKEISWQLANSEEDLSIMSTVDSPSLRWYLRDMKNLEVVSILAGAEGSQALITPVEEIPALKNQYIGSDFSIGRARTPHQLDWQQKLSWWLFRETPIPIELEQVILWLRADLAGASL